MPVLPVVTDSSIIGEAVIVCYCMLPLVVQRCGPLFMGVSKDFYEPYAGTVRLVGGGATPHILTRKR
jgi:hypothetical protein